MQIMTKAGLVDEVGRENFCDHIDTALARAQAIEDSLRTDA
jgi:SulP family sulfate permease